MGAGYHCWLVLHVPRLRRLCRAGVQTEPHHRRYVHGRPLSSAQAQAQAKAPHITTPVERRLALAEALMLRARFFDGKSRIDPSWAADVMMYLDTYKPLATPAPLPGPAHTYCTCGAKPGDAHIWGCELRQRPASPPQSTAPVCRGCDAQFFQVPCGGCPDPEAFYARRAALYGPTSKEQSR